MKFARLNALPALLTILHTLTTTIAIAIAITATDTDTGQPTRRTLTPRSYGVSVRPLFFPPSSHLARQSSTTNPT